MLGETDELAHRYASALTSFLEGGGEAALERAYEVGRALIVQGRGVVELAGLHGQAEALVLAGTPDRALFAREANRFLAEALAPFEMTLRGFEELNRTLEVRVQERTRELERAQAMFHQAQKMETVGRLAGGVAHDFNNLLSVMLMNAELALQTIPAEDPIRVNLEEILQATTRASALTRQLLAFSRKQILAPTLLSLNDVVGGVESMLRRLIGESVTLRLQLAADLPRVSADKGQLEQVVMNLVVNARDAMPGGGTITIETELVRAGAAGDKVRLSVVDTGTGIAPDVVDRIFEPFFTTKPEGHGTGLGLATCYGIVRQSGGTIDVKTELGKGTRFDVLLPSAGAGDGSAPSAPSAAAASGRAAGILVVEDDAGVRRATVRALEAGGHKVYEAKSGEDALDMMRTPPGPVDLLLTDIAMPGINGRELAERLVAAYPKLRVLFASGYSDDEIVAHGVRKAEIDFLQKPVRPQDLLAKVREILSR